MPTRWIVAAALALYLLTLIGVGLFTASRTKGFRDYVTGGGAIPPWMLALSFVANYISANSFIGHAAQSYRAGLIWCVVAAVIVACCVLSWHVFAPRFAAFAREHGAATLPDYFAIRFDAPRLAALVNWIVVVSTVLYVLAVLRSTALVASAGLGVSYEASLLLLYGVTLVYCLLGGLWADVSTDVVQAFVLAAGAIALFAALITAAPPEPAVAAPPLRPPPLGAVLAIGLAGGVKMLIDPKQVLVFYAFKDEAAARRFRWIGPLSLLVLYGCLFPAGYLARRLVVAPDDLDRLIPALVFEQGMLGGPFGVVLMISLFAASMSSLDSALLVVASCVEKHALAPRLGGEPSARRTRLVLVGAATLALLLSLRPLGGIIELTTLSASLLGAALLPAICAGISGLDLPARAVGVSIVAGLAGVAVGRFVPPLLGVRSPWLQDIFVGLLISSATLAPAVLRARGRASAGGTEPRLRPGS